MKTWYQVVTVSNSSSVEEVILTTDSLSKANAAASRAAKTFAAAWVEDIRLPEL